MSQQLQRQKQEMNVFSLGVVMVLAMAATGRAAAAEWSSSNIQLLHGSGYKLADEEKTILTVEHANGWQYGDNFFFLDVANPNQANTALYAEFSPRLSLSRISGRPIAYGVIKDLLLAAGLEMGDNLNTTLWGVGLSLDLPGFAFTSLNFYRRESYRGWVAEGSDPGWQTTLSWSRPFTLGDSRWLFEVFADYAFGESGGSSPKSDNLVMAPRLLFDVADLWGAPGHLLTGIEYQVWRNKYGVEGVDEDVAQAMVKWVF